MYLTKTILKSAYFAITRVEITTQKFRTPSSANFLGSRHISGLKLKSYYEIWTFWSKLGLQMIQFHSCCFSSTFSNCEKYTIEILRMRRKKKVEVGISAMFCKLSHIVLIFLWKTSDQISHCASKYWPLIGTCPWREETDCEWQGGNV